jgi:alpha-tubulin suppressor-like RCC1 family protein
LGYNEYGQIGNESKKLFQLSPIKLNDFNEKFIVISCGFHHSKVLTDCDHAYNWGRNQFGQLELEEREETYFQRLISKTNKWKESLNQNFLIFKAYLD